MDVGSVLDGAFLQLPFLLDHLAKREKYKGLRDMDAVHYYIITKFKWLPRDVRSMSYDDLRLVLTEEMEGWVAPEEAR